MFIIILYTKYIYIYFFFVIKENNRSINFNLKIKYILTYYSTLLVIYACKL
jgi:hypothetical protein